MRSSRPSIFRIGELNLVISEQTDGTNRRNGWTNRRTDGQTERRTHHTAGARRRISARPEEVQAFHFLSRRFCVCSSLQQKRQFVDETKISFDGHTSRDYCEDEETSGANRRHLSRASSGGFGQISGRKSPRLGAREEMHEENAEKLLAQRFITVYVFLINSSYTLRFQEHRVPFRDKRKARVSRNMHFPTNNGIKISCKFTSKIARRYRLKPI